VRERRRGRDLSHFREKKRIWNGKDEHIHTHTYTYENEMAKEFLSHGVIDIR